VAHGMRWVGLNAARVRARVLLDAMTGPPHHGIGLLTAKGRAWLDGLGLPSTALEQVTVALRLIDMLLAIASKQEPSGRLGRAEVLDSSP
jgi:hypothetical protein